MTDKIDTTKLIIRNFKAVPIYPTNTDKSRDVSKQTINKETIKKGFLFDDKVLDDIVFYEGLIDRVVESLRPTIEQKNNSFHKSWDKVKNASDFQLVVEQMAHYITTYGFEQLGVYDENTVYVPYKKIDLPELGDNYPLVVIKGLTEEEIKEKCINMFESGIALKEETINELFEIVKDVGIEFKDIDSINNKEVRIKYFEHFNAKPESSEEFLRLLVYKATGQSLLIKSPEVIDSIKENSKNKNIISWFEVTRYDYLAKLSKIFNRYKPLFLAFKNEYTSKVINKIAKYSKKYHQPMKEDFLNTITEKIGRGEKVDKDYLMKKLGEVNSFRKIRLLYALQDRINEMTYNVGGEVYSIRNGKTFVKEQSEEKQLDLAELLRCSNTITSNIIEDLKQNVKGKKVYIPENIEYVLPTSEKQFTGNIPNGSFVRLKDNIVFGVHWFNTTDRRVDLDLSLIDKEGRKIGWNTSYRNDDRTILYSGDMTDAPRPKGASELITMNKPTQGFEGIVVINDFNYVKDSPVPYTTWVGSADSFNKDYMFNQNNVEYECESTADKKETIIGLVDSDDVEFRYYFTSINLKGGNISSSNEYTNIARKRMLAKYKNMYSLNNLLQNAGAIFVENQEEADIDLDFRTVEKDTFINLFLQEK